MKEQKRADERDGEYYLDVISLMGNRSRSLLDED